MSPLTKSPTAFGSPRSIGGLASYGVVILVFAVVCFVTALLFERKEAAVQEFILSPGGEAILSVGEKNQPYLVRVSQSLSGLNVNQDWSHVTVEIDTLDGQPFLSFGEEFWSADGYDDGYWSEVKNNYDMKVTFPDPGDYRVHVENEASHSSFNNPIKISFIPKRGSSLPFYILGVPSLLAGVGIGFYANRRSVAKFLEEQ